MASMGNATGMSTVGAKGAKLIGTGVRGTASVVGTGVKGTASVVGTGVKGTASVVKGIGNRTGATAVTGGE